MIPLVDDFIQTFIVEKLLWLKRHPTVIDHIFYTGKRETLAKLKDFITSKKVKVIIGYPKEQTSLPAYVITLAPEQEQPIGLGDNYSTYEGMDLGISDTDDNPEVMKRIEREITSFISGTYMNSTYRIECWSDNGDLTSYMYTILKWCLWSSRSQMLDLGWVDIKLSGTDLEPVPDYMPMFIYRRAAQINLTYENLYYENLSKLENFIEVIEKPETDPEGNIVDPSGNIIIPAQWSWLMKIVYYDYNTGVEMDNRELTSGSGLSIDS